MGKFSDFVQGTVLIESIEPRKPVGKIVKRRVVKNRGMINSKEVDQIQFVTTMGNDVKVQIQVRDGVGDVVFYVNDTLNDGGGREKGQIDWEILSGVLWVIDRYADKKGLNGLTFSAWTGTSDRKVIRGMDVDKYADMAKHGIREYMKAVGAYKATIIPPNAVRIALAKKLGREPITVYDVHVGALQRILGEMLSDVENGHVLDLRPFEEEVYARRESITHRDGVEGDSAHVSTDRKLNDLIPGANRLLQILKDYNMARLSQSDEGAVVARNRRQSLYRRLFDKFFSHKWSINQNDNFFELTRKNPLTGVSDAK